MSVTFRNYFILLRNIAKYWNVSFQQMALENVKKQQTHTHTRTEWEKEAPFEGDTANVISHVCVGHGFHEWCVQSLFNWCVAFCEPISTCKCIGVLRSHSCPHALSFPVDKKQKSARRLTSAEQRRAVQLSLLMAPLIAGADTWVLPETLTSEERKKSVARFKFSVLDFLWCFGTAAP